MPMLENKDHHRNMGPTKEDGTEEANLAKALKFSKVMQQAVVVELQMSEYMINHFPIAL